jgi:hypothetical protein
VNETEREVAFPEAVAGNEDPVGRFVRIQTREKESLVFGFLRDRGLMHGIQVVTEDCIQIMGLFGSLTEDDIQGLHSWIANEDLAGRFVRNQIQGKESLCFDFRHEGGFRHGSQPVMEDCIQAMGLFVSVTEDGFRGSHERFVFEMKDGIQGFGMVGVR